MQRNKLSIKRQLIAKGINNLLLLDAFQNIPDTFLFAETVNPYFYEKSDLTNSFDHAESRVIVIAKMLEQLQIKSEEKILLVGVESIYILIVLSKIYKNVYSIEPQDSCISSSLEMLKTMNISNVHIKNGNPIVGWNEKGPFNVILIAPEFNNLTEKLKNQLQIGAKLLAPVGPDWTHLILEIVTRNSSTDYNVSALRDCYFIPKPKTLPKLGREAYSPREIIDEIGINSIPFKNINEYPIDGLLERIGNARVVLIGAASHGTAEFYLTRQNITKALIEQKGFNIICTDNNWSDTEHTNNSIQNKLNAKNTSPLSRFPHWCWKNEEINSFLDWLTLYNKQHNNSVGIYGLDLYGYEESIKLVIKYLQEIDPLLGQLAKKRYTKVIENFSKKTYNKDNKGTNNLACYDHEVLKILIDLLKKDNDLNHCHSFFNAYQNANVVINADRHYQAMRFSSAESWNLRSLHMFHTLQSLLSYSGSDSKAIIWGHNADVGNAFATEVYANGEINLGHLCKEQYGDNSYHIGFGTHKGTLAASSNWGAKMKIFSLQESLDNSFESLCHKTKISNFTLPLRAQNADDELLELLAVPKLQRSIGILYSPKKEAIRNYSKSILPMQYDEYIWYNTTQAITPTINNKGLTDKLTLNCLIPKFNK